MLDASMLAFLAPCFVGALILGGFMPISASTSSSAEDDS